MLRIEKLRKEYGAQVIFSNLEFELAKGEKIGLIGLNGIGKSTLLRILAGKEEADEGAVHYTRGRPIISYVPQDLTQEEYRQDAEWMEQSGGMRTWNAIEKAFREEPDLLILDEPNNHLDDRHLELLEKRLESFRGTLLMVSHDRVLLDHACSHILEMKREECRKYTGNYSTYVLTRETEEKDQRNQYEKYQREKTKLKQDIIRHKEWYKAAHKAAGQNDFLRAKAKKNAAAFRRKETALARLEENKVLKPWEEDRLNLAFTAPAKTGRVLIRAEEITKNYGSKQVLNQFSFYGFKGERYHLIGENGSGKSTFLNILAGRDTDFAGKVHISPSVKIGYFTQHHLDLDAGITPVELIMNTGLKEHEARNMLGAFLLRGDQVFKRIGELSQGQRSKLAVLRILLEKPDLLLLDEPVNHMDLLSIEKIEEALMEFRGTILFVSHDRRFNEKMQGAPIYFGNNEHIVD